jgi:hypothetical protein
MSLIERIFPHGILTYDWVVGCTDHPEFLHELRKDYIKGSTRVPCSFHVLFKCF